MAVIPNLRRAEKENGRRVSCQHPLRLWGVRPGGCVETPPPTPIRPTGTVPAKFSVGQRYWRTSVSHSPSCGTQTKLFHLVTGRPGSLPAASAARAEASVRQGTWSARALARWSRALADRLRPAAPAPPVRRSANILAAQCRWSIRLRVQRCIPLATRTISFVLPAHADTRPASIHILLPSAHTIFSLAATSRRETPPPSTARSHIGPLPQRRALAELTRCVFFLAPRGRSLLARRPRRPGCG